MSVCDDIRQCLQEGNNDDIRNGLLSGVTAVGVTLGTALLGSTPMGWGLVGLSAIADVQIQLFAAPEEQPQGTGFLEWLLQLGGQSEQNED